MRAEEWSRSASFLLDTSEGSSDVASAGEASSAAGALRSLARQVLSGHGPRVDGPIEGALPDDPRTAELVAFRARAYADRMPHLLDSAVTVCDVEHDARSTHFVIRQSDEIVGALRATVAPFEFQSLSIDLAREADRFAGYVEFSRLIVQGPEPGRSIAWGAIVLIAAAVAWAIDGGAQGLVALCQSRSARLFGRFGLAFDRERSFLVPSRRDTAYWILHGTWQDIVHRLHASNLAAISGKGAETT